jgi:hypothetical protein
MQIYVRLAAEGDTANTRVRATSLMANLSPLHRDATVTRLSRALRHFPWMTDDVTISNEGTAGILCTMPAGLITNVSLAEFQTAAYEAVADTERYGLTED